MVLSFWREFYGGECSFQELRREGKGPDTRAFGRHLSMANGGSVGKASDCHAGDPSSIPEWGRSPGGGNGNLLPYPCLENPMDRGAWHHQESDMTERLTLSLSAGVVWGLRLCISHQFPGDVMLLVQGPHFENHCTKGWMWPGDAESLPLPAP